MKLFSLVAVVALVAFGCMSPLGCTPSTVPPAPGPDATDATPAPGDSAPPVVVVDAAPAPAVDVAPAPPPDPSGCLAACANLAKLGCPEGRDVSCVATCAVAQDAGGGVQVTDLKPACLASAQTPAAARACGTVKCIVPPPAMPPAKK